MLEPNCGLLGVAQRQSIFNQALHLLGFQGFGLHAARSDDFQGRHLADAQLKVCKFGTLKP